MYEHLPAIGLFTIKKEWSVIKDKKISWASNNMIKKRIFTIIAYKIQAKTFAGQQPDGRRDRRRRRRG